MCFFSQCKRTGCSFINLNENVLTWSNSCTFLLLSPMSALSAIQLQRNELKLSQQRSLFCTRKRLCGLQPLGGLSEHGRQIKLASPPFKSGPGRTLWLNSRWSIPNAAANWSKCAPATFSLHHQIIPHFQTWVMQKLSLPSLSSLYAYPIIPVAWVTQKHCTRDPLRWKLQT